ncbi:MAG: hypothetical protein E7100_09315 [Bacteroidaceae bacterium]|nr:hypothetical protein [Bacteroidaceae bacterium]
MHCVFHGIRFKVDKDWVSEIDTLLFLCPVHACFQQKISTFVPIKTLYYDESETPTYHYELPAVCCVGSLSYLYG